MESPGKRVARWGMLVALALLFSYLESLFPISLGIPGIKLGLANVVTVFSLYVYGFSTAFAVSICRVLVGALLFGNLTMAVYSLAGAITSLGIMVLLAKSSWFSLFGVSMAGGVAHNVAQVVLAIWIADTWVLLSYLIILIPVGMITGLLIALLVHRVQRALSRGHSGT